MGWPSEILELPDELKDTIFSKKCVAFIGSGASAGSYDDWCELVNRLCIECGSSRRIIRETPTEEYLAAAQDALDHNETTYYDVIADHFNKPDPPAYLLYDALLSLPFSYYVTVNLDPLLAMKARTARLECLLPPYAYPALDRQKTTNRSIHYLHGFVGQGVKPTRRTIVLTQSEFDEAYDPKSNLMHFLVPTLESDPVCFIGCGLREPVMEGVFKICMEHQLQRQVAQTRTGHPWRPLPLKFILLPKPEVMTSSELDPDGIQARFDPEQSQTQILEKEKYYAAMDIKVVWYIASGGDHSALRRAFEQLAELPDITPDYSYGGNCDAG